LGAGESVGLTSSSFVDSLSTTTSFTVSFFAGALGVLGVPPYCFKILSTSDWETP